MYLTKMCLFRCDHKLYLEFKEFINQNPEIENFSHGVRIAMIKYIREYRKGDRIE